MNDAAANLATLTTPAPAMPLVPAMQPAGAAESDHRAARGDVAHLAASLAGTGIAVAAFDARGRLIVAQADAAPFFVEYAVPAFAALGPVAPPPGDAPRLVGPDRRVAGVYAAALPAIRRTGGAMGVTLVAFARRPDVAVAEFDRAAARGLSEMARAVPAIDAVALVRLATLGFATLRADAKLAAVQGELDAVSGQLSDTYEELTLIYQVSSGMRVNRTVDDFFLQACSDVIGVIDVRGAGYVVTDASGRADAAAIYGEVRVPPDLSARLASDLLARFATNAKPLLVNDLAADATFSYLAPLAGRLVAVAIQRQEKLLGTLFCFDKRERDFTTQDSKLLNSIGNETAIYLENSALFADARGLTMGLLHALTSAVDAKDAYTCGHSQRVALFAREIAQQHGLPEAFCERVYMAGLLHDVGKIGVPEEVLRKPGKLTNDEFDLMKRHVDIGSRILKDLRQIEDLVPGVLYHHERYDGKGYPHNLAGQQIPLIARILCVADCFDAMTSNRTYRKALPVEVAMMEIRRCAGTQFDPLLADAFLAIGEPRLRQMIQSVVETAPEAIAAPAAERAPRLAA
jgi:HD-GYP domain-containing protein (c-di-GMP phosphodiesterase class II)